MRQPSFLQGEEMASMLIDRLAGISTPHARIMPTGLVVRQSA
jgi:DNA-binding LacI/PurR family transcriptional regulator